MQELGDKLSVTNIIGHGCTRIDWKNIDTCDISQSKYESHDEVASCIIVGLTERYLAASEDDWLSEVLHHDTKKPQDSLDLHVHVPRYVNRYFTYC